MAEQDDEAEAVPAGLPGERPKRQAGKRRKIAAIIVVVVVAVAVPAWLLRKDIADDLIARQLDKMGLPARYEITRISPQEQIIRNLVIGDPARPDLTVDEVRVATQLFWGIPGIGRITVVRPRLYGSYRGGRASFGSLDKVLFGGKGSPFQLPDLDIGVVDGRALIDSDFGRVGVKLDGQGALRGGFDGKIAAITPALAVGGCQAGRTTLYGRITVADERPRFNGPVRTVDLACPARALTLKQGSVQADLTFDKALDGGEGQLGLALGSGAYGTTRLAGVTGSTRFAYRRRVLTTSYDLTARDLVTPHAMATSLSLTGQARTTQALRHFDVESDLKSAGLSLGGTPQRILRDVEKAGAGTLVAALAAQLRGNLARELKGSTFDANLIVRRSEEGLSLVAPRAALRGRSGASLVAISRLQALVGTGAPHVTGNFTTGGQGLPQAWGRMETDGSGGWSLRASMNDYRAGTARIAVPGLTLTQGRDGALSFTGQMSLSGALPGGQAQNVRLPVEGRWAANGDLSLWRSCTDIAFDGLRLANLTLERRKLSVCPAGGSAVLASRNGVFTVAAGVPALDVIGKLGETPIRIASGAVGYAQNGSAPGVLKASALKVTLGPTATASHFAISRLDARIGKDVTGTFDEADLGLYAVPLDLKQTSGRWRYAGGVVSVEDARFTLVDRQPVPRFQPMVAQGAWLRLADNKITAQALLREPTSQRAIVRADIAHDLTTATGHADLAVDGIQFDEKLQAPALSKLAEGVVSALKGVVTGNGRIDWNERGMTSHGRFASTGLDFAAPFGPVKGMSGEVELTDLLGLVSAPDQKLYLASINPGIEVTDGVLSFQMEPNFLLRVNGAKWPFMDGTLTLDPTTMRVGVAETRRYTLRVTGLNAASFVQRMDVANLAATGTFDGVLPLVFDDAGGRIEEGSLTSRPPGGNVAYNGALTYKDLSTMGNFAFDALRSVNYQRMEIGLGGSLSGDIVTRISFDGLSQGATARRNFITRQVAKLPIRFVVNVKAPFFSLFGSMRSLYDPNYITDPRELDLLDANGKPRPHTQADTAATPLAPAPDIQPPVSENER
ncbi:hypothetical protein WSK_2893 [Novosphingobium sp. Rr 2-17]|uniref:YdbH domain-containing protein n=1 Tax=Novosphingobium sp. Rr 2-17 TaxID=555793 RepID=UPI0002699EF1|nr:YdbH domain-containing protein [Novosphingobium sp. Rr 2-17]EIZ78449.1 hypothetical protein WSK_2893 [Novosphingobium sp. Rr 2-17]